MHSLKREAPWVVTFLKKRNQKEINESLFLALFTSQDTMLLLEPSAASK